MTPSDKITIAYIDYNKDSFDNCLGPSLNALPPEEYELISVPCDNRPAQNYNTMLDMAANDHILFVHQDIVFSPNFLEHIRESIDAYPDFGVLGVLGYDSFKNRVYSVRWESNEVVFFDAFCVLINKKHGIRFDELTFDDLHLYVEDYCVQALNMGLKCRTALVNYADQRYLYDSNDSIIHYGMTYLKQDSMWGKYNEYFQIFKRKWNLTW